MEMCWEFDKILLFFYKWLKFKILYTFTDTVGWCQLKKVNELIKIQHLSRSIHEF